jgi:hypothetical protein
MLITKRATRQTKGMDSETFNVKLSMEDRWELGVMFDGMLREIISTFPKDFVISQKDLIKGFCKSYKKFTEAQVNRALIVCGSKFRGTTCYFIYNNKICGCQYMASLEKRLVSKLKRETKMLNELNNYL